MMNVGRCPRCHKFLVAEEEKSYLCVIPCQGAKSIFFDHIHDALKTTTVTRSEWARG
jgi:phage FluMu protein Com